MNMHDDFDPRDLVDLLQQQAARLPDFPVLTYLRDGEEAAATATFADLDKEARAIAQALSASTQPGDRVMLLYLPGMEFTSAYFGCLYAGRIAVPLPPPRPARLQQTLEKLLAIAASAAPRAVLTTRLLADKAAESFDAMPALRDMAWIASEEVDTARADDWRRPQIDPHGVAFLQYTSGSTALPKGVMLTHANLLANTEYFARGCAHGEHSSLLNWLPPFHDLGLIYGLLTPIRLAIRGYIMPNASFVQQPSRWVRAISRYRITHTMGPNFAFDLAMKSVTASELAELDLSCWQGALNGAEPVRMETMRAFTERFAAAGFRAGVFNPSWGLAEASCIVTGSHLKVAGQEPNGLFVDARALECHRVEPRAEGGPGTTWLACSGYPIGDTELAIVDPATRLHCAADRVGEIWVRNAAVGAGYWENPQRTEETFGGTLASDASSDAASRNARRWMRTGDLGFLHDGQVVIAGRMKDVIIIRGRNHYPQDIEHTVDSAHPLLRPAGAAAFAVQVGGEEQLCVVAETDRRFNSERDTDEVLTAIRRSIADSHELKVAGIALIRQGTIPKTTSGKVQRRATSAMFLDGTLEEKAGWRSPALLAAQAAAGTAGTPAPADEAGIEAWLRHRVAELAGLPVEAIRADRAFADWGLDSNDAVRLSGELEREFAMPGLPTTLLFDHPTPAAVACHLAAAFADSSAPAMPEHPAAQEQARDDIVVVGMHGRFPGAPDLAAFWQLLREGHRAVGMPSAARRALGADGEAGWLDDIDGFDAPFFHLAAHEAERMDPRQRLLLMSAWHALEAARIPREQLAGSRTGVFVGISGQEYGQRVLDDVAGGHAATGGANSIVANRLSYFLDLRGPSVAIDTACSSSLVALHMAWRSLRDGECDTAIVAGVNLLLDERLSATLRRAGMLSPSGACHSFDASADGYVRGEGVVTVVLRRRDTAEASGNPILARIAGSAVNQDGRSFGLTAPNGNAQQQLLRAALDAAGIAGATVQYVEAHGTGTALGDPIEWNALNAVVGADRGDGNGANAPCLVGTVKANIGHLEAAAGLAGFVKAVLCLRHQQVPPVAGLSQANPRLDRAEGRLQLADGTAPAAPLRHVGITSMGFGGTNAHVILERHDTVAPANTGSLPTAVLPVSAESEGALRALCHAYARQLREDPAALHRLSRVAAAGRSALSRRAVAIGTDAADLAAQLEGAASLAQGDVTGRPAPRIAFVFGGQGAQQAAMGAELYRHVPAYREAFDAAAAAFAQHGLPVTGHLAGHLAEQLYGNEPLDGKTLAQTAFAQPALFACEYALARTLMACGIQPAAAFGHSLGEYMAACIAGALDLEDAALLVATRARLMSHCTGGAMLAVTGRADLLDTWLAHLPAGVELAAVNAPGVVTLTGPAAALDTAREAVLAAGFTAQPLQVETAFHSALMDPVLGEFGRVAAGIGYRVPVIPLYGNLRGTRLQQVDGGYWVDHLRGTVRFADCVVAAQDEGADVLLEIAPQAVLAGLLRRGAVPGTDVVSCVPGTALRGIFAALARLYCIGARPDWAALAGTDADPAIALPAYPFDLASHWISTSEAPVMNAPHTPAAVAAPTTQAGADAAGWLRATLAELLRCPADAVDNRRSFLESGADSLVLTEFGGRIETRFAVKIELPALFEGLDTIDRLAAHVATHAPVVIVEPTAPASAVALAAPIAPVTAATPAAGGIDNLARLFEQQLATLRDVMALQMAQAGGNASMASTPVAPAAPAAAMPSQPAAVPAPASAPASASTALLAPAAPAAPALDSRKAAHIDELARAYTAKTAGSRAYAEQHRAVFADYRSSLGFKRATKEMIYPLVVDRGAGSHVTDIDGNDYVDLTMAFGSCLFGHNPPMVVDALRKQLVDGIQVGPKSPLSGRAAALVARLTGAERVAFANSGTEAVMTAIRLARAVTGRTRIIRFTGSYHGHSDATLASAGRGGIEGQPGAPGVPASSAREVTMLEWGTEASLQKIRELAPEAAAIIAEPVQSRRPGLQPKAFLHELRRIADETGCALMFDEMITGFRLHAGGAQAWYDVRADIVTYGKVAGGGMPIGVIAGRARFMDAIDGGAWRYGDDSAPRQPHTFFAGTFSAHPLTMASCIAVLERIEAEGEELYRTLNGRTARLAARLNAHYAAARFPIHVDHAGSLLRFVFFNNFSVEFQPIEANLFFYHMTLRGVYIWEGHTCFLTTAHDDADIERIVAAAIDSANAMRAGGFFPGGDGGGLSLDRTAMAPEAATLALDDFALAAFADALVKLGWRDDAAAPVTPAHAKLLNRMLEHLGAPRADALRRLAAALPQRRAVLAERLPQAIAALADRCAVALPDVLAGRREAVDVLFRGEGFEWLTRLYAEAPGAAAANERLVDAVADCEKAAGRPLRILEAGAGTGTVARRLLARLGAGCDYWYTDISPAFLARAERELADDRVTYRQFDLTRGAAEQGIEGTFDVIVAANVVHATPDLAATLARLDALLVDGGTLLLQECTQAHAWLDLVFGITEGWWQRDDTDVRPDHALMPPERWLDRLATAGFTQAEALLVSAGQAVLRARPVRDLALPMSEAQRQILVHLELGEQIAPAYNEGALYAVTGDLDAGLLAQAWTAAVARHPLLRAQVAEEGECFVVPAAASLALQQVDFSMLGDGAKGRARDWIAVRQRTPLDPRRGPLAGAWLLSLPSGEAWLYLLAHHLVIDGMSFGRLAGELWALYGALKQGGVAPLKPVLPVDAACRKLDEIDPAAAAYWRDRLAQVPPAPELPVDRPLPAVQRFEAGRVTLQLPAAMLDAVRRLGAAAQATPFMTLNAAWRLLLARLGGAARFVIGVPVSVHPAGAAESYVGFGVNVVPLTTAVVPEQPFTDFLRSVRTEVADALAHRAFPFADMVRAAGLERDPARPALVQVLFNCEAHDAWQGAGVATRTMVPPATHTKYELTLDALLATDGIELVLTYSAALFDEATAQTMLRRYAHLLERIAAASQQPLAGFDALLPEERQALAAQPAVAMNEGCLHRLCEAQAARDPDAVALRCGLETMTFGALDARANRLAHALLARGVRPEDRVAVCLPRTADLPVALLAVLKAGAAYVPVDPAYPAAYIDTVLRLSGAALVITAAGTGDVALGACPRFVLDDAALEAKPEHAPAVDVSPCQLAYVIFTSGSTGEPKGVAIEHRTVCTFLDWAAAEFTAEERAGMLASTSVCFDLSVFELFLPLAHGGRIVLVDNVLALTQGGDAGDARFADVTLVNTVPSAAAELAREQCLPPAVRVLNLAGEALPQVLVDGVRALWPQLTVCNLYGPTEDTTYSTWLRLAPGEEGAVTIGRPLPGTRLYLLDEALQPVPAGAQGEICLAGNGLARGYLGRPGMTAERFIPDPLSGNAGSRMYRTGDLGRLLPDGTVEYLGRRDDQLKIRGHRVELGAIDAALRAVPGVEAGAVVAHSEPARLAAFYSAASDMEAPLRAALAERLPRWMVPSSFHRLAQLPLTPNGKTDRRALAGLAATGAGEPQTHARQAPRNAVEEDLAQRFAVHLGLEPEAVGIDGDFFALGGHSLLATRLLFDVNQHWHAALRLSDLMTRPTVAELSQTLLAALADGMGDLHELVAEVSADPAL
ncbi:non-ribosomal peptide synthetase/type I polyketide synthase [Pseudoduganella lutea]|uniref:Amino acid adenylation domain-containing protein n=1 Tax=Pseudoduganella lutea TaxID=321985 RepID=A0A4P6KXT1_9BURK|nr:non-ribosomal peptide synthetase/type I polyketide synthase [Pseudoduganella lutea]QBE63372.1 amino acid adenylation domain-containing protein [Pseudoduganella lutea]